MKQSKASTIIAALFALSALIGCAGGDSKGPAATATDSSTPAVAADDHTSRRMRPAHAFALTTEFRLGARGCEEHGARGPDTGDRSGPHLWLRCAATQS